LVEVVGGAKTVVGFVDGSIFRGLVAFSAYERSLRRIGLGSLCIVDGATLLAGGGHRGQQGENLTLRADLGRGEQRHTIYDAKGAEPDPPKGTLVRGEG